MTIYLQVTDGNQITIQMNDDATIHLHSYNRGIDEYEPIMKTDYMTWKAGMYLLKLTCSKDTVPEENKLQIANLLDVHENTLAEMDINKATYTFFYQQMDGILADKECISEGFD